MPHTNKKIRLKSNTDVVLISVLLAIYLVLVLFKTRLPIAVLLGPLMLLMVSDHFTPTQAVVHSFPFLFFLGFQIYTGEYMPSSKTPLNAYLLTYNTSSVLSVVGYSVYISKILKIKEISYQRKFLVRQLLLTSILTGALFIIILMLRLGYVIDLVIEPMSVIYAIILGAFILTVVHLFYIDRRKENTSKNIEKIESESELAYGLTRETVTEYGQRVEVFFNSSKDFLNINFNLQKLSKALDIPKHHLSVCFINYFGMNFYNLLAKYRVEYAITIAARSTNFTWDSIAYDCGYCSRSTFNKHFKNFTGYLPSEIKTKGGDKLDNTDLNFLQPE